MSFCKTSSLLCLLLGGFVSGSLAAMEFKEADITTVKNIVERNEGSGAVPAKVNDKIRENSKVSTSAASMAELTFADTSITRMGANTQFSFQSKERLVKLDQGTVLIHTPPGNGGATVDCGGVTAAVTGTTFMASHDVSGNVMFVLLEGQGGLKVTVGGTSTVIRPGQAASIGADAKKEASTQENSSTPGGEKVAPAAGSNAKVEEKGGGGAESGSAPGPKSSAPASPGGGESAAAPAPASPPPPKIQVFDVDVKKVVATTPLIVDFKKELPSISKIEKVVETQQAKVQEGKLEKTETEVVLIKNQDGDILVGSPKVNAEETVVVNRKEDMVAPGGGTKDNLDVETAAGPGAGTPAPDARPVAAAAPPPAAAPAPPPAVTTPPVNPGQIVAVPNTPTSSTIAVTAKVNDSSRFFNQNNPSFGFSITSGSLLAGHSLVTDFLTSANPASPASGAPYSVNFANTKIVDGSGADVTSRYNLTTLPGLLTVNQAPQNLTASPILPRPTGSLGTIPILGVMVGSPTFSILERDGRATVDNVGNVTVGKILGANSFTLRVDAATDGNYLSAQKDLNVGISQNVPAIEAANPTRQYLVLAQAADLAALDEFFYFTGKATGYSGEPDRFFATAGVGDTDRTLNTPGASISLYSGQNWDFYAARKFTALPGTMATRPAAGKLETVFYANTIDLGNPNPQWQGLGDPRLDSASLGYRYLTLQSDYLPTFLAVIDSASGEPYGFTDPFGSNYFPLQNFPVWDDEAGMIASTDLVHVDVTGSTHWTLAAGTGGIAARGLEVAANGAGVQMMTSGDMDLKTVKISDVGSGQFGDTLVMEARGKVKMGVDASIDLNLDTSAGLAEGQQVRLEGRTDAAGSALSGSLAVVRTGDSLELRNVTIRGFAETRLEKLNSTTKAVEGRVLISGSAVRDFKIKELVGAAVNADAKIQMMALDAGGQLAGDMVVEGKMPVRAKLASALAEAGETLPKGTEGLMVDAKQIDLAARNLKFENANLVAMNSITARANTILVKNSFMTVVRNQGMINMYVQSGLVNPNYGTMTEGRVNFAGANTFRIGGTSFSITDQSSLTAAYGNSLVDITQNGGAPQAGKVNVLKL